MPGCGMAPNNGKALRLGLVVIVSLTFGFEFGVVRSPSVVDNVVTVRPAGTDLQVVMISPMNT